MIKPTVHLNGTSAQSLANQYGHARQKVREALEALQHIETHGRDYYVQGPNAYHIAAEQHQRRVTYLSMVHDDLLEIEMHVSESL